eukprot:3859066-Prymnesium_polylepis.1
MHLQREAHGMGEGAARCGGRVGAAAYQLRHPLDRRVELLAGLRHPGQRPAQGLQTAQRAA